MGLELVLVALLAAPKVEVVKGGQFFHRPGHLMVDDLALVEADAARREGYTACPECGAEAYFRSLIANKGKEKAAVRPLFGVPAAPVTAPVPEKPAPVSQAPVFDLPADGLPVPGTGGLLKVPTFKGSGGIIAVPLPYGGYTVVQPPYPTGSATPPAGDPAPSAR